MTIGISREWTRDEKQRLTDLAGAGQLDQQIAQELGRPIQAVSAQRMLLGIRPNRAT